MRLYGVDFTSAPSPRKPIIIAGGHCSDDIVHLDSIIALSHWSGFEQWLRQPGPWIGGFDFPFGLPRELLVTLDWPHQHDGNKTGWQRSIEHLATLPRAQMVEQFRRFCNARPVGAKFAHRACDLPAGSSPSMKWVNPPVAFMLQAGTPRLLQAGVDIPGLHRGDASRVALEAYPGLLARAILGHASYKSDDRRKQDAPRRERRERLLGALQGGDGAAVNPLRLRLRFGAAAGVAAAGVIPGAMTAPELKQACIDDGSGDRLDAALCLLQAAWGWLRRDANYGMPVGVDPLEGWIVATAAFAR